MTFAPLRRVRPHIRARLTPRAAGDAAAPVEEEGEEEVKADEAPPMDAAACIALAKTLDASTAAAVAAAGPSATAATATPAARLKVQLRLSREYLALAEAFPPRCLKIVKKHIFQMLFGAFMAHPRLRGALFSAQSGRGVLQAVQRVAAATREGDGTAEASAEQMAGGVGAAGVWYSRHRGRGEKLKKMRATQMEQAKQAKKRKAAQAAAGEARDQTKKRCKAEAGGEGQGGGVAAAGGAATAGETVYSARMDKERHLTLTPPPPQRQ